MQFLCPISCYRVIAYLFVTSEEEKDVVRVGRVVQNLVKFRAFTILDVSNHWVGDDEKACARKSVVFLQVPKANHCIVSTVHEATDGLGVQCTFGHFRILFGDDTCDRFHLSIEVDLFV